jgi:hypothetical protein
MVNATSCKNKTWDPPPTRGDATMQLRVSADEFDEIASACRFFANELGGKLPPVVSAPSPDELTPELPLGPPQSG